MKAQIAPVNAQPDDARAESEWAAGKSLVHYTFEEDAADDTGGTAGIGHNVEAAVEDHYEAADRKKVLASGCSLDALRINFEIGGHLIELKKLVPHGDFEREVQRRLGFKKAWQWRLRVLADERPNILKALDWAKANNHLTRSEYSVDGALALLKRWQHKVNGENTRSTKQKSFTDSFLPNETFKKKADIVEFLKQVIILLRDKVKRLEQRNAFLEAELRRWDIDSFTDTPPAQPMPALPAGEVSDQ